MCIQVCQILSSSMNNAMNNQMLVSVLWWLWFCQCFEVSKCIKFSVHNQCQSFHFYFFLSSVAIQNACIQYFHVKPQTRIRLLIVVAKCLLRMNNTMAIVQNCLQFLKKEEKKPSLFVYNFLFLLSCPYRITVAGTVKILQIWKANSTASSSFVSLHHGLCSSLVWGAIRAMRG